MSRMPRRAAAHPMGTDRSGCDVLVRVIHGSRVSLSVGFLSVGVAVIIGLFVGAVSAYHGGWVDLLLQRVVEIVICFPTFLLILTIMAFVEKRSIFNVMLVIGLTGWTDVTRLVRGQMLSRERQGLRRRRARPRRQLVARHAAPPAARTASRRSSSRSPSESPAPS